MNRLRQRRGWMVFLLVVAVAVSFLGKSYLFAEAICPRLQDLVLYAAAGLLLLPFLLYALLSRDDSLVRQLMTGGILGGLILAIATLGGGYLSGRPEVRRVYCPQELCDAASWAASLREQGKSAAAADVARECLQNSPGASTCAQECARELGLALFDWVGQQIDTLPNPWMEKQPICQEMFSSLKEGIEVTRKYGFEDLNRSINERQQRVADLCTPPPPTATPAPSPTPTITPTPVVEVEVLRAQRTEERAYVDFKVYVAGKEFTDLTKEDVNLVSGGEIISFDLEHRAADDPVCVVAVVDNSGSISPGLHEIRLAIEKMNALRKPGDELGMVVFSEHDDIKVIQPSSAPLDSSQITGAGTLTALWDATLQGLDTASGCKTSHRYLIVLTDGRDNDSVDKRLKGDDSDKARQLAGMAAEQGVGICAVGIQSSQLDEHSLQLVAYGCGYYPAKDFDQVASVFQKIFGYVRDFYRISWKPSEMVGHSVQLRVLNSGEVPIDVP